jgi:hypothetical protein
MSWNSLTSAQESPAPGPEHAKLKALEGQWDYQFTMADGSVSTGRSEAKFECGGLWLVSDFKGEFGGQPFQGRGLDGYDPVKKKYVSVWVDSVTTYPMIFEGDFDANKPRVMLAKARGMDGQPAIWRSVTTVKDDDHHKFEMFIKGSDGQESNMMTIEYTRRK